MSTADFGKYRLIAELGHGGMADVFLAVMAGPIGSGFSKLQVIKRLRQNLADEPEFIEMLMDEARISARLNHPNVVQTNEVGSVGSHYFLAMEYLDGQPLHRILHRATQWSVKNPGRSPLFPNACRYAVLMDTLAGLHHAHELADYDGTSLLVVHRDATPHNIFVTYEGQVKVVDFGIAKAVGRASETRQGVVKGKVRYMAPEQALGRAVDRRADVFSVGVMLWEAAAGQRLWKDHDDMHVVHALVSGATPTSPRAVDPTVPEAIDRICQRALAAAPTDRYPTAEAFRLDLETYLAESGALVDARRRLGADVSELFGDKRSEIRSIIERQLAVIKTRVSEGPASGAMPIVDQGMSASGASASLQPPARSTEAVAMNVDASTGITDAATSLYRGGAPAGVSPAKRSRKSLLPAIALGGIAVVAVTGVAWRRSLAPAQAFAPEPVAAPAAAPPPAQAAEIHLKMSALPANARISIDGVAVASPFDGRYPRDEREHAVRVEAPGHEPHVETVRFDGDVARAFTLNRSVRGPAGSVPAGRPAAARAVPPAVAAAPSTVPASPAVAPSSATAPAPSGKGHGAKAPELDKSPPW